jgi:hypothetical protein
MDLMPPLASCTVFLRVVHVTSIGEAAVATRAVATRAEESIKSFIVDRVREGGGVPETHSRGIGIQAFDHFPFGHRNGDFSWRIRSSQRGVVLAWSVAS